MNNYVITFCIALPAENENEAANCAQKLISDIDLDISEEQLLDTGDIIVRSVRGGLASASRQIEVVT
jgi:hypothetical protein